MAVKISKPLKRLLKASILGGNKNHPLAGWYILTILYHDGSGSSEPSTRDVLLDRYNHNYLERDENPLTDPVMKDIMQVLSDEARLVDVAPRKIRMQMRNGGFQMRQSAVYKITSSGIEYLSMMQKVVDAESTVTANITRINEFCDLVHTLNAPDIDIQSTKLFNTFRNMVTAYADVMKGMHKLDEDLDELANNLAFDHGSKAAEHLKKMLNQKAIPAFKQLLEQGSLLRALETSTTFSVQVARSQQGTDDLNTGHAIGDKQGMVLRLERTQAYVQRQLAQLTLSFNASSSAIDSSLDSLYLLFHTIMMANKQLSMAFDAIQGQTVDVKVLTKQIEQLLPQYRTLVIDQAIPRHLALDRELEDAADFLEAKTMGPVKYAVGKHQRLVLTEQDNPDVAEESDAPMENLEAGLAEFKQLVMLSPTHGVVDHALVFKTQVARDEVVKLYSATGYDYYESFAPFGRSIVKVIPVTQSLPVSIRLAHEQFTAWLPGGFEFWFEEEGQNNGGTTSK